MLCPHCGIGIRLHLSETSTVYWVEHEVHKQYGFDIAHGFCPECEKLIVLRRYGKFWQHDNESRELYPEKEEILYPARRSKPIDPAVPPRYKTDFLEALAVLDVSAKASAAISRRLLQDILENHFGLKAKGLAAEIDLFLEIRGVPGLLAEQVDAVRNVGNLASHPWKDTRTGEVMDVEPGEAEWLIGTLEALLEFAFVQPRRVEELRNRLNAKLDAAGKPPLK